MVSVLISKAATLRASIRIAFALAMALPLAAHGAASFVDDTDYWRVVEVTGDARMLQGANPWNAEAPLGEGDVIGPYQSISTGPDGTVILVRGDDVIVVYENATIELPAPAPGHHAETQILQRAGDAYYAVDPRPEPQFEVQTPHLIVGVKGTEFALTDGGSQLSVVEGLVDAADRASGTRSAVPAGQGIGTERGGGFVAAPLDRARHADLSAQSQSIAASRADWQDSTPGTNHSGTSRDHDNGNSGGNGNGNSGGNGNGHSGGNGNGHSGGNGNGNSGGNGNGNSGGNGNGHSGGNGNGSSDDDDDDGDDDDDDDDD